MRMTLPGSFLSCFAMEIGQMGSELESTNTQNVLILIVETQKKHRAPQIGFDLSHAFATWWNGHYWLQVFVWANFVFEYSISSVIDVSYIVSSESELSFGQVILFHKWTSVACQKSGFHLCCTITAVKEWSHWRRDPKQKGETHTFATMHIRLLLICLLSTESSLSNELFIDFSVEGTPVNNFWSSTGMTPQVLPY